MNIQELEETIIAACEAKRAAGWTIAQVPSLFDREVCGLTATMDNPQEIGASFVDAGASLGLSREDAFDFAFGFDRTSGAKIHTQALYDAGRRVAQRFGLP
jgi:hypothetical protein